MHKRKVSLGGLFRIACLTALLLPARAQAWGGEGHRIVCGIAWQRLAPPTRALVTTLLGAADEKTFVDACLWADQVRDERPETAAWHYINIPPGQPALVMARDCAASIGRCAPWAIIRYARALADANMPAGSRAEALKFVLHFVGDIHQPLHAGRPHDRGGNEITVDFFGNAGTAERPMNLHSVWDSQILRRASGEWPALSRRLANQVRADEAAQWESLDVVRWTNESYRLCEDFVYGKLPADRKVRNAYFYPALGYAEVQLQKAGVRLAHLLNQAAAGTAPAAI